MKAFLSGLMVIAVMASLTACDKSKQTDKAYITKKEGAVNQELCSGLTPFIIRTKTGAAGEVIVCVDEATFSKYSVGDTYP